jgi:hypothetical protein
MRFVFVAMLIWAASMAFYAGFIAVEALQSIQAVRAEMLIQQ